MWKRKEWISMAIDSAKALVAKLKSDKAMAEEFKKAKSEAEFLEFAKKHGYNVSVAEFGKAAKAAKKGKAAAGKISDKELDQVAGGISIVGVDYSFTVAMTAKRH